MHPSFALLIKQQLRLISLRIDNGYLDTFGYGIDLCNDNNTVSLQLHLLCEVKLDPSLVVLVVVVVVSTCSSYYKYLLQVLVVTTTSTYY